MKRIERSSRDVLVSLATHAVPVLDVTDIDCQTKWQRSRQCFRDFQVPNFNKADHKFTEKNCCECIPHSISIDKTHDASWLLALFKRGARCEVWTEVFRPHSVGFEHAGTFLMRWSSGILWPEFKKRGKRFKQNWHRRLLDWVVSRRGDCAEALVMRWPCVVDRTLNSRNWLTNCSSRTQLKGEGEELLYRTLHWHHQNDYALIQSVMSAFLLFYKREVCVWGGGEGSHYTVSI